MPRLLEEILAPLSLSDFLERYSYKKAVHVRGAANKFQNLFNWDSLNDLLASLTLTGQQVKMSKGGSSFFSNNARRILAEVNQGATLILEDIDNRDPNLRSFLNGLSDEICSGMRANLYLSFPNKQGYRIHYDTHDFFILQLEGFKEWSVYPATMESPLFYQKEHGIAPPAEDLLYLNCTLAKGDVLYVPKGHWHKAVSVEEPSMHLTLAMFTPTGIDFLDWLVDELREDAEARRTFPFLLKENVPGDERSFPALDEFLAGVKGALMRRMSSNSVGFDYHRYAVAKLKNRVPFTFPLQLVENIRLLESAGRFSRIPQATFLHDAGGDKVELVYSGRTAIFDRRLKPLLKFVLTNEEFTKSDLTHRANGLSWEQILQVLFVLVKEGLIVTCG